MKQTSRQLIIFLFLTLITSSIVFARGPAVEPVSGIAIDQYDDVPPSKATPFTFGQKKTKRIAPVQQKSQIKQTSIKYSAQTKSQTQKIIIIAMICFLPIAVWLGLMKGIKDLDPNEHENVISLHGKSEKEIDHDDHDDIDFPKAS